MTDESTETGSEKATEANEPAEAKAEPGEAESTEAKAEGTESKAEAKTKKKAKKAKDAPPIDDSPEAKELREAEIAFEVGDYKKTRELAAKLATSKRAKVADGARDLLRRTDVDPAQLVFLAMCACALIGIAYHYLGT